MKIRHTFKEPKIILCFSRFFFIIFSRYCVSALTGFPGRVLPVTQKTGPGKKEQKQSPREKTSPENTLAGTRKPQKTAFGKKASILDRFLATFFVYLY